jgi:hypothetical protein
MFPHGLKGFNMPIKLPDVELKLGGKQHVSALQCLMDGAVCMVARVLVPEQKKGWNVAGKQTGNMEDVLLKPYKKRKSQ